ncbi:MAG: sulfotransferase domain-containing protein, partial [Acidimicrobiales bacterium]
MHDGGPIANDPAASPACGRPVARAGDEVAGRLPDFLIIGAPKSGTQSLARWLSDHPNVFFAAQKELNCFSDDILFAEGPDSYRRHFADAGSRLAAEASPTYLASETAPSRIPALIPKARLIAILRDPVERAYAHYWWRRNWGAEKRDFVEAITQELSGRHEDRYTAEGHYVSHLRRFAAASGRDDLQ